MMRALLVLSVCLGILLPIGPALSGSKPVLVVCRRSGIGTSSELSVNAGATTKL